VTALTSHLYDKLMLAGNWVSEDGNTLTFEYTDDSNNHLVYNLGTPGDYSNVFISSGVILPKGSSTPGSETILRIVSFDFAGGMMPNTVTVFNPAANEEYTLTRA